MLRTSAGAPEGHGFAFTIGRGNEVQVAAIGALREYVVGRSVAQLCADPASLHRDVVGDRQPHWLGPAKGVMHMAIGAVVNAVSDLAAKVAHKPLWQLLTDATSERLVGQADFRYLTDALTPEEAPLLLRTGRKGADERAAEPRRGGYPAYTTSPDWLGYSDEERTHLARQAVAAGFTQIKLPLPRAVAGFSATMHPATLRSYAYPSGAFWAADPVVDTDSINQHTRSAA